MTLILQRRGAEKLQNFNDPKFNSDDGDNNNNYYC